MLSSPPPRAPRRAADSSPGERRDFGDTRSTRLDAGPIVREALIGAAQGRSSADTGAVIRDPATLRHDPERQAGRVDAAMLGADQEIAGQESVVPGARVVAVPGAAPRKRN